MTWVSNKRIPPLLAICTITVLLPCTLQGQTPIGTEFQVNTFTQGDQRLPDVAIDGSAAGIFAQRFAAPVLGVEQFVLPLTTQFGVTALGEYEGLVEVAISGVGGTNPDETIDAFYMFEGAGGATIGPIPHAGLRLSRSDCACAPGEEAGREECAAPDIIDFIVFIDGLGPVSPGTRPAFQENHEYRFVIDLGDELGPLTLGIHDCGVFDNYGAFQVSLRSISELPTPTPTVTATPSSEPIATFTNSSTPIPSPTPTPNATDTESPPSTPTFSPTETEPVVSISVGSVAAAPGQTVTVDVMLMTDQEAAAAEIDIGFPPEAAIAADEDGEPRCAVNPDINKNATAFAFFPSGCQPAAGAGIAECNGVRALVFDLFNLDPIPSGSVLYSCQVHVARDARPGDTLQLDCSSASATTPGGDSLITECIDGQIAVISPPATDTPAATPTSTPTATQTVNPTYAACTGNCDAGPEVTIDEVIRGVNIALENFPLTVCVAFDSNRDGFVTISELIRSVNNLLFGCGVIPPTRRPTSTRTYTQSPTNTLRRTPTVTRTPTISRTPTRTRTPTITRTRTATRRATPTRTRTPTPRIIQSVCGGPVTSVPRLCNLTVSPPSVSPFGSITVRFGLSDLEGDVNLVCIGVALVPFAPVVDCEFFVPRGTLINEFLTLAPVPLGGVPQGTYVLSFAVGDSAGHVSNAVSASFTVF